MYPYAESGSSYLEHCVTKEVKGSYRLRRILLIAACAALPVVLTLIGLMIPGFRPIAALFPLWIAAVIGLGCFLWPYVSLEYEYTLVAGSLMMDVIYGKKNRRRLCEVTLKEAEQIAPYQGEWRRMADSPAERRYEAVSSLDAPEVYFARFTDEKGRSAVLFFEAPDEALPLLRAGNRLTVSRDRL